MGNPEWVILILGLIIGFLLLRIFYPSTIPTLICYILKHKPITIQGGTERGPCVYTVCTRCDKVTIEED